MFDHLKSHIVLKELHEVVAGKHFVANIIVKKNLDVNNWWPILLKDIHELCRSYDSCQKIKNKKSSQVGNNTSKITFYEVGSRFYRSN